MAGVIWLGVCTLVKSLGLLALLEVSAVCVGISLVVFFGKYNSPFCPQAVRKKVNNSAGMR